MRLIPAHAGKTVRRAKGPLPPEAHPRSRGENDSAFAFVVPMVGSSPLTRGKLRVLLTSGDHAGLIPAHAGKTSTPSLGPATGKAHPRSRGENDGKRPDAE